MADGAEHQPDHDHGKRAVEQREADDGGPDLADGQAGGGQEGRQLTFHHPGLPADLGQHPAQLDGDPRQRDHQHRQLHEPAGPEIMPGRAPEGIGEEADEHEPKPRHGPEQEEHHRHVGNGAVRRRVDVRRARHARIGDIALQQQGIAIVGAMQLELFARRDVVAVGLQRLHRVIGQHAALDADARGLDEVVDAEHRAIEAAGGDDAQHPGHMHFIMGLARRHVRDADDGQPGRRLLGLPHGLEAGQLHALVVGERIA